MASVSTTVKIESKITMETHKTNVCKDSNFYYLMPLRKYVFLTLNILILNLKSKTVSK